MGKIWMPGDFAPPKPEKPDPRHQKFAEVECPKCANRFLTLNRHWFVICWREPGSTKQGCGWFLRTYPRFGKLYADPVAYVTPSPITGRAPRALVNKCILAVRDYWVKKGIAEFTTDQDRSGIRFKDNGLNDWEWFDVATERANLEARGKSPDGVV